MGAALFCPTGPYAGGIFGTCAGPEGLNAAEWLLCLGEEDQTSSKPSRGGRRRKGKDGKAAKGARDVTVKRLEELTQELFNLHDLNDNGLLEEDELVQLNERIALLHHGTETDVAEVRTKYRELFRAKLDSDGHAVTFEVFGRYARDVLDLLDPDPEAQEMILEQWVAEALSGRQAFDLPDLMQGAVPRMPGFAASAGGKGFESDALGLPTAAAHEDPQVPLVHLDLVEADGAPLVPDAGAGQGARPAESAAGASARGAGRLHMATPTPQPMPSGMSPSGSSPLFAGFEDAAGQDPAAYPIGTGLPASACLAVGGGIHEHAYRYINERPLSGSRLWAPAAGTSRSRYDDELDELSPTRVLVTSSERAGLSMRLSGLATAAAAAAAGGADLDAGVAKLEFDPFEKRSLHRAFSKQAQAQCLPYGGHGPSDPPLFGRRVDVSA